MNDHQVDLKIFNANEDAALYAMNGKGNIPLFYLCD